MVYRNTSSPRKSGSFKGNARATSSSAMQMQTSSSSTPPTSTTTSWPRPPGCPTGIPSRSTSGLAAGTSSEMPGRSAGMPIGSSGGPNNGMPAGIPAPPFIHAYMLPRPRHMYGYPPPYQRFDYSYVPQHLNKIFFPPLPAMDHTQPYFMGETVPTSPGYMMEGTQHYMHMAPGEILAEPTPPSSPVPRPRAIYQGVKTRLNFLDPGVQSSMPNDFTKELQRQTGTGTLLSITGKYENDTCLDIATFEFKISNFSYVKGKPVKDLVAVVSILSKYDGRLGFQFDILNDELAKNCNISVELLQQVCEKVCI